jgi:hypothetical protein
MVSKLGASEPYASDAGRGVFRTDLIFGGLLRWQGELAALLAYLKKSWKRVEERKVLIFDEDLRELTCKIADMMRELHDLASAKRYLRAKITRREQSCISFPGQSLLELSLAEIFFAQECFDEAERLG